MWLYLPSFSTSTNSLKIFSWIVFVVLTNSEVSQETQRRTQRRNVSYKNSDFLHSVCCISRYILSLKCPCSRKWPPRTLMHCMTVLDQGWVKEKWCSSEDGVEQEDASLSDQVFYTVSKAKLVAHTFWQVSCRFKTSVTYNKLLTANLLTHETWLYLFCMLLNLGLFCLLNKIVVKDEPCNWPQFSELVIWKDFIIFYIR